jgi:hypothetical protein
MKRILLLMTMISMVPSTFGQSCEIKRDGVGNNLNGTTVVVPLDDQMAFPYSIHLEVTNTSGADETWSIKRVKVNVPDGWSDLVCWPPQCCRLPHTVLGQRSAALHQPGVATWC